jgi:hypothetical protein
LHEACEHPPHLDGSRSCGDDRVGSRQCLQLVFIVGLDDAEASRSAAVEHRTEDDHLTGVDERLPVGPHGGP